MSTGDLKLSGEDDFPPLEGPVEFVLHGPGIDEVGTAYITRDDDGELLLVRTRLKGREGETP